VESNCGDGMKNVIMDARVRVLCLSLSLSLTMLGDSTRLLYIPLQDIFFNGKQTTSVERKKRCATSLSPLAGHGRVHTSNRPCRTDRENDRERKLHAPPVHEHAYFSALHVRQKITLRHL